MDTFLIPAALVLILTNIVFAYLAERCRRSERRTQLALDQALANRGKQRQLAYNDGLFEGWKRGWGESYTAACKAERLGLNPTEAIHRIGKLNAPALLEEPEEIPV